MAFLLTACASGYTQNVESWYSLSGWRLWIIPLAAGILVTLIVQRASCRAGADWFARGKTWVNTYELATVRITEKYYRTLALTDSSERQVRIRLSLAQGNQDLWDLVYNGILHSADERDVDIDASTRNALELPLPPLT